MTEDLSQTRFARLPQEQLQEHLGERFRELDTLLLVVWSGGGRRLELHSCV